MSPILKTNRNSWKSIDIDKNFMDCKGGPEDVEDFQKL